MRGDANGDAVVDIADAVFVLNSLFVSGSLAIACADAGDSNDDSNFNIADAIAILNRLFSPGAPPLPA